MGVSPRFAAGAAMPEFIGGSRPRGTASFRGKPGTGPRATTRHDEAITQARARRARARRRAEAGRSRRGLVRRGSAPGRVVRRLLPAGGLAPAGPRPGPGRRRRGGGRGPGVDAGRLPPLGAHRRPGQSWRVRARHLRAQGGVVDPPGDRRAPRADPCRRPPRGRRRAAGRRQRTLLDRGTASPAPPGPGRRPLLRPRPARPGRRADARLRGGHRQGPSLPGSRRARSPPRDPGGAVMIDALARTAADDVRTATLGDAEAGLADLHVRQASHRRRALIATAAAVVLAGGVGAGVATMVTRADRGHTPAPAHPVTRGDGAHLEDPVWQTLRVRCLGNGTYRFGLVQPVDWATAPGFTTNAGSGATAWMVESYRRAGPVAGVTVMERVQASTPDGSRPAPGVAEGPRAFVQWVAGRPFLDAGAITHTTLDGHPAWQVRVVTTRDARPGTARCNNVRCHAVTYQPDKRTTGMPQDTAAEYTAFRAPGGGTTVVWSWIFSRDLD